MLNVTNIFMIGWHRFAHPSEKDRTLIPMAKGARMRSRSGRAITPTPAWRSGATKGTAIGIKTIVPIAAITMNAAE